MIRSWEGEAHAPRAKYRCWSRCRAAGGESTVFGLKGAKPKPRVLGSIPELQIFVSGPDVMQYASGYLAGQAVDHSDVAKKSLAGNTFRGSWFRPYGVYHVTPSGIYRPWATDFIKRNYRVIAEVSSCEAMIDFVWSEARNLVEVWDRSTGGVTPARIEHGKAAKFLCLLTKQLLQHPGLSPREREHLVSVLNVPLDSFTLQGIRLVAPDLRIPSNATMKFVRDGAHYRDIQLRIKELMPVGCFPIHYDFAAWDLPHRS
jgi:hypothetical protein